MQRVHASPSHLEKGLTYGSHESYRKSRGFLWTYGQIYLG